MQVLGLDHRNQAVGRPRSTELRALARSRWSSSRPGPYLTTQLSRDWVGPAGEELKVLLHLPYSENYRLEEDDRASAGQRRNSMHVPSVFEMACIDCSKWAPKAAARVGRSTNPSLEFGQCLNMFLKNSRLRSMSAIRGAAFPTTCLCICPRTT